ncbi:MAG: helix-turn-helix domain-containing protein [Clostridia bacterium]|nr:helix-turn-helix domain-containing protein [Clostridia bacterium]
MDYIERIKKIKSEKKITNEKLSELTGIPLGTLSKITAGISDSPKLSNIVSIADALGYSLDYIVKGIPENNHNCTLSKDELALIERYRELDVHSRELVSMVVEKESQRVVTPLANELVYRSLSKSERSEPKQATAKVIEPRTIGAKRTIMLYNLPVSAGTGVYLDDTEADTITVTDNERTRTADFALRISGDSMEPRFHDGDVVLVEDTDSVEVGELGIFVLDGNGYFKKYGGDRLISLNPDYGDILLRGYTEMVCCGRVVGRLKRR